MAARGPLRPSEVVRLEPGRRGTTTLELAVEAPLEIRVAGEAIAVTMRTPGHDRELALGFLFSEGLVTSIDDVGSVAHCGRTGDSARENVIDVVPAPGVVIDPERRASSQRGTVTTSACGACGRVRIDDLLAQVARVTSPRRVTLEELGPMLEALRASQAVFHASGGSHGAALFDPSGARLATFEDVGRHNAVDKLVGARLLARALPLTRAVLVVSGRTSFDVVHKALAAGVSAVVGLGAPSDLAVDMARRAGLPLYGFARRESVEEYA